jgi:hypothetical protein
MIERIREKSHLHFWRHGPPRRLETRGRLGHFLAAWRSDELISVSLGMVPRRGFGCHAGEARAKTAIASRIAAQAQSSATGQADAMAIFMRRTLMRTIAPAAPMRLFVEKCALAPASRGR